jgi:hypothetical protein
MLDDNVGISYRKYQLDLDHYHEVAQWYVGVRSLITSTAFKIF